MRLNSITKHSSAVRMIGDGPASSQSGWEASHGLLIFALIAAAAFVPAFRSWPMIWVAPLIAYAGLVAAIPPLRASYRRWRLGRMTRTAIWAALLIVVVSCFALVTFHFVMRPDVGSYAAFLPASTPGGLLVIGVLFSIFNALFEEIIFRGILFNAVESQWGAWGAVFGTALLFGYGHLRGYPPGVLGASLAGIYGLGLGWLRVVTGGIGMSVVCHIFADATIFIIVARSGVL